MYFSPFGQAKGRPWNQQEMESNANSMKHVPTVWGRDKAVILAVTRRFGPLSRVDIQKLTQLRQATISLLVRALLDEGKLLEVGRSDNPMGRKQVLLRLNEKCGLVIGVDFDAEFVVAATAC